MVSVCFPGRALSKDLVNLPTLAFRKRVLKSSAGVRDSATCFAIE